MKYYIIWFLCGDMYHGNKLFLHIFTYFFIIENPDHCSGNISILRELVVNFQVFYGYYPGKHSPEIWIIIKQIKSKKTEARMYLMHHQIDTCTIMLKFTSSEKKKTLHGPLGLLQHVLHWDGKSLMYMFTLMLKKMYYAVYVFLW